MMIPFTVRQMLDLPSTERSAYLARMSTSCEYVFDSALEDNSRKFIRRLISRHGGVWREHLVWPGGTYYVATFRTISEMHECSRDLAAHINKERDRAWEEAVAYGSGSIREEDRELWYPRTWSGELERRASVPALKCAIVDQVSSRTKSIVNMVRC